MERRSKNFLTLMIYFDVSLLTAWHSTQDIERLTTINATSQNLNPKQISKMNAYVASYIRLSILIICGLIEPEISNFIHKRLRASARRMNFDVSGKISGFEVSRTESKRLVNLELVDALERYVGLNAKTFPKKWIRDVVQDKKVAQEFQFNLSEQLLLFVRDDLICSSITDLKNGLIQFFPFSNFKVLELFLFKKSANGRSIAQILNDFLSKNQVGNSSEHYKNNLGNYELACRELECVMSHLRQDKDIVTLLNNYTQHLNQLLKIEADVQKWKQTINGTPCYLEILLTAVLPLGTTLPKIELLIEYFEKKLQRYLRSQQVEYIRHLAIVAQNLNYRLILSGWVDFEKITHLWYESIGNFSFNGRSIRVDSSFRKVMPLNSELSWAYCLTFFIQPNLSTRSLARSRIKWGNSKKS